MSRTGPVALLLTVLISTAACGSSEDAPAAETSASDEATPETTEISGSVLVESLLSITYNRNTDECEISGPASDSLDKGVTILDHDGTKVAIGRIDGTEYSTYQENGETFVNEFECTFNWTAPDVPVTDGIYTAEMDDFDVSENFELSDFVELSVDLGTE